MRPILITGMRDERKISGERSTYERSIDQILLQPGWPINLGSHATSCRAVPCHVTPRRTTRSGRVPRFIFTACRK